MKKLMIVMLVVLGFGAQAQILHPVTWSYGAKGLNKNEAMVFLKATIEDGWHIYSTQQKEGGPIKTSFKFTEVASSVTEPMPLVRFEKAFGMEVAYFEHSVVFTQRVKMLMLVNGSLTFMACNDQKCLAPETVNFSIPIP